MTGRDFSRWDRNSRLYSRFTENAQSLLETDEAFQQAQAEWEQFFTNSHGDIFQKLQLENPRERVFVDSLYYDFVVDQIIEFAADTFGFTLVNQEARENTDALSFSYRTLHEQVVDPESVARTFGDFFSTQDLLTADIDFLRNLYESIVSRDVRLALGEYYTPKGVAQLAFADLEVADIESETFLDPGCGSGVFLSVAIEEKCRRLSDEQAADAVISTITDTVYGIDLNPVAVKSSKLSYVLSLLPILERANTETVEIPVFLTDALRLTRDDTIRFEGDEFSPLVDHLLGNPPWITWGTLTDEIKDQWRAKYVDELDLFPHRGVESRLGHGNDDISVPYVWVCIHQYLANGGDASFVLKRDIMKGPAGKLLRTLRVNDRPLSMQHIHDFNTLRVFGDEVRAGAAIYTLRADERHEYPIPTTSWTRGEGTADFSTRKSIRDTLTAEETEIVPVEEDEPRSSWIRHDAERGAFGECEHTIRHGIKGDAKDVFGIDRERLAEIEPDFVYPYVKSKHVVKYGLFGYDLHLVPLRKANEDNEAELANNYPETYDYLDRHREQLEDRSSSWLKQGTFYNVFGLGDYTWATYKVVWCRLGFKPHFAVVSTVTDDDLGQKTVVPGDHFMFIATENEYEAHFLCALLNSSVYQRSLRDIASGGKSTLSKSVVSRLELPEWQRTDDSERLAELSMQAHDIVPEYTDVSKREYNQMTVDKLEIIQAEIDEIVESMLSNGDGSLFPDVGQSTLTSF